MNLADLQEWMISPAGQGTATWLSAILSLAAIMLALRVFLVEQKRALNDRLREVERSRLEEAARQARADQERDAYVSQCVSVLDHAIERLEICLRDIASPGLGFVEWSPVAGVPQVAAPILDALEALRSMWHKDVAVVMATSHASRSLKELVVPPAGSGIDSAPSQARAQNFLATRISDLHDQRLKLLSEMRRPAQVPQI